MKYVVGTMWKNTAPAAVGTPSLHGTVADQEASIQEASLR